MKHKKTAAVIAALALLISAAAPAYAEESAAPEEPAYSESSYEELPGSSNITGSDDIIIDDGGLAAETEAPVNDYIQSGEYSYSYTSAGTVRIEGCTSQEEELTVPDYIDGLPVTELGAAAFAGIPAASIALPASIEYISADNPFVQCESLQEITVSPDSQYYTAEGGVLCTKDKSKLVCYPQAKVGNSFAIPEGVSEVGVAAFYNSGLSGITFPSTLTKLGRHSLSYCTRLGTADLSGTSLSVIDVMAFMSDSDLSEVLLPDTLYEIGMAAFYGCTSLRTVELPQHLHIVGQSAFADTGLTSITVPDSVENIGYSAFGYDSEDQPIDSFIIIGSRDSAAETYSYDYDDEYGYQNSFTFMTPEEAESEQDYLNMETYTSGEYVYIINDDGTAGIVMCSDTSSVINVPSELDGIKVTSLVKRAFMASQAVTITLPDSVTSIGENAFYNCTYLEALNIPAGCLTIEGDEPFYSCPSLSAINVTGEGGGGFSSVDGVLYNADKSVLLCYPQNKPGDSYKAPGTLREIAMSAFAGNKLLKSADLSGVTDISNFAFDGCSALEYVRLSRDLKLVGNDAFYDCPALKSVRLYGGLETIGDYAFGYRYDESLLSSETDNLAAMLGEEQEETDPSALVDGFRIYADKDSLGWKYAKSCGIETVAGTVAVGTHNVSIVFLIVIAAIIAAVIIALIAAALARKARARKEERRVQEIKASAAERIRARRAAEKGASDNENK